MRNLDEFLNRLSGILDGGKTTLTDAEIAAQTQTSVRTTQRYLKRLRDTGTICVQNKRHLHHAYGWCNERTLFLGGKY